MRVLVTGATGFLGSHVAGALHQRGDDVRVLVRRTSDRSRLEGIDVDEALGDVTDLDSVKAALRGVDAVVHCAALVEFGASDPSRLEQVNALGAHNVLGAAADLGLRIVHVSSLAAYGPSVPGEPPKDETWWAPGPLEVTYERTKRTAHEFARSLGADGASVRIVAPGGIYGYGDQSTMSQLIETFSRWPMPVGYIPDVRQTTVNVDDCAAAILSVLDADDTFDGQEFLAAAEVVTLGEWIAEICKAAGRRPPLVNVPTKAVKALARPGAVVAGWFGQSPDMVRETMTVATQDNAFSGQKLRDQLAWQPRPLPDGMREMVTALTAARRR